MVDRAFRNFYVIIIIITENIFVYQFVIFRCERVSITCRAIPYIVSGDISVGLERINEISVYLISPRYTFFQNMLNNEEVTYTGTSWPKTAL